MDKRFVEPPAISIRLETCAGCGLCSRICPTRLFRSPEAGGAPSVRHPEECVLCGHCLGACPTGSIIHSGLSLSHFRPIRGSGPFMPEAAFQFLSQRRSLRNYRTEAPSKELLEKIAQIAGYAPGSPHHRVGWVRGVTIVNGTGPMKAVLDMTAEYMRRSLKLLDSRFLKAMARFSDAAKAGRAVVPDLRMRIDEYSAGRDSITYHAPAAMFFHAPASSSTPQTDCDTALFAVQLYAEAFGLGSCWNGLIQMAAAGEHLHGYTRLAEFLRVPQGHKCYAAMTLGFPASKLHSLPERMVDITWIERG